MGRFIKSQAVVRTIIFVAFFAVVSGVQVMYTARQPTTGIPSDTPLPVPVLRGINLGLDSATASLIWLDLIQGIVMPGGETRITGAIQRINALDPAFTYPYAFGELLIPTFNASDTPAAIAIGKRGVELHLPDWRIPYYLAVAYYVILKDKTDSALYFDVTANTPGVPEGIRQYSIAHKTASEDAAQTREMWVSIYQNSRDEVIKDQAAVQVGHIDTVDTLRQAIALYESKYGHPPHTIEELVTDRIVREIPVDPLGITYTVDSSGKLIARVQ